MVEENFALCFSLKFLSILLHISGSIHSDLGITGTKFSSSKTQILKMPIFVNSDDVRSGTKANACHGQ